MKLSSLAKLAIDTYGGLDRWLVDKEDARVARNAFQQWLKIYRRSI